MLKHKFQKKIEEKIRVYSYTKLVLKMRTNKNNIKFY